MINITINVDRYEGYDEPNRPNKTQTQTTTVTPMDIVQKFTDPISFYKWLIKYVKREDLQSVLNQFEEYELYEYCKIIADRINEKD